MKECRKRYAQMTEKTKLRQLIQETITEQGEEKPEYWVRRLYSNLSLRFNSLRIGTDWIVFLSELNDEQVCGRYQDAKTCRMLKAVRDAARVKNMYYIRNGKEVCDTHVAGGNPAIPKECVAPLGPWYS